MLRTIGIAALLALAAPVMADDISYNYIDLNYAQIDIDDSFIDVDGDALGISGSFEIGTNMHIIAGYATADFDLGVDFDELIIGTGFHTALSDNVDFVANFAYVDVEASALGVSVGDDGFGASVGLRAMVSENFELAGFVDYVDLGDGGDDTSIGGDAWYNLSDNFALGVGVDVGDDVTSYGVGARFYFGR